MGSSFLVLKTKGYASCGCIQGEEPDTIDLGQWLVFSLQNHEHLNNGACIHQAEREQKKALIWRPLDLLFVVYLVAAMGFTIFRGLVNLCSPYICL